MTTELLEFFNENTHRNYPLSEEVSGASSTGNTSLPTSFLVDLDILCPTFMDGQSAITESDSETALDLIRSRFSIATISWSADHLVVEVAYTPIGSSEQIIFGRSDDIPVTQPTGDTYYKYNITPILQEPTTAVQRALSQAVGTLYVCTTSALTITGSYTFTLATARLHETCIHMYGTPESAGQNGSGLASIILRSNDGEETVISDDFVLRAADGVAIEATVENGTPVITISPADSIEELTQKLLEELGTPIQSISGISEKVTPGLDGNITLVGNDCVSITPAAHGLSISNPCSKPCCDDADTQAVTNALNALEEAKTRLESYYQALATNINTMQARLSSLIAARNGTTTG